MTMQCKSDMVNVTMQRETQYCITMNSNNIYNMHGTDSNWQNSVYGYTQTANKHVTIKLNILY